MSFWQQAGRVGRRAEREALVVLVAGDDALDQYHIQHPDAFFGQSMEHAAVDPSQRVDPARAPAVRGGRAAARCSRAGRLLPDNAERLVERLVEAGELSDGPPWRPRARSVHADVSLRGTSREPYTLQVGQTRIGTIEPPYLQRECYPGALYLHNGRGYRVEALDERTHVVRLEPDSLDARTTPLVEVEVAPRDAPLASRSVTLGDAAVEVSVGPLRVCETVVGFRESRRGESMTCQLEKPLDLGARHGRPVGGRAAGLEPDLESLHAFEHALVNALPLGLLCDRRDIGSQSDERRLYVYDFAEGGIGLAEKAFHVLERAAERGGGVAARVSVQRGVSELHAAAGLPAGQRRAGQGRRAGAARGARRGRGARGGLDRGGDLRGLDGSRRASRASMRSSREGPGVRRRLRSIADDDRRERYGLAPKWLEAGRAGAVGERWPGRRVVAGPRQRRRCSR